MASIPSKDTLRSSLRKGGNDARGPQDVDPPAGHCLLQPSGAKQDWQAFFEAPATRELIAHASFATAQAVFEFGCGTGAFAEQVLAHHLPPQAKYLALDSSATMVRLTQSRLERFGARVVVRQTDGFLQFADRSGSCDRFVSNYVLDLLSAPDRGQLLAEAHRLLVAGGRLCLVSLTPGSTRLARLVTWFWTRLHALDPRLVGGCRPLELRDCLPDTDFHIDDARVITRFGIPSEVVVASRIIERGRGLLNGGENKHEEDFFVPLAVFWMPGV